MDPLLDNEGETYIRSKHFAGGSAVDQTKGIFSPDVNLDDLVDSSLGSTPVGPNDSGFYERTVNYGSPIGETSATDGPGQTSWFMLVQDKYGAVITMYPTPPQ
jgi:hypothetical protein